jgi:hypothetical protein
MEPGLFIQLEPILQHMSVGIVLLDCANFRVRYANPYLISLLEKRWHAEGVVDQPVEEVIPDELREIALPILHEACATGQRMSWSVPRGASPSNASHRWKRSGIWIAARM